MGSNISRPSITAAQIAGVLISGVPIVAALLHAFGVYDLSGGQQDALKTALQWGVITAGSLFGADAALRAARNHAHAKVEAVKAAPPVVVPQAPSGPSAGTPATGESPDPTGAFDGPEAPGDGPDEFEGFVSHTAKGERILPNVVWRGTVCNCSTRHGETPRLIVIHDTEGGNIPHSNRDLFGLRDWFNTPAAQVSAHYASDADGNSIQMVPDGLKAWHVAFYNPVSLGVEQVHKQGDKWTDEEYDETARIAAWWCRKHKIPVQRAEVSSDGRVLKPGIIRHKYLGHLGGDHHDPIPPWNQTKFMRRVKHFYALQQAHHKI